MSHTVADITEPCKKWFKFLIEETSLSSFTPELAILLFNKSEESVNIFFEDLCANHGVGVYIDGEINYLYDYIYENINENLVDPIIDLIGSNKLLINVSDIRTHDRVGVIYGVFK